MPKIPVNLLPRPKREYERLTEIYGNCPKYVLTADEFSGATYDGIKTVHIADLPWSAVVPVAESICAATLVLLP